MYSEMYLAYSCWDAVICLVKIHTITDATPLCLVRITHDIVRVGYLHAVGFILFFVCLYTIRKTYTRKGTPPW